LADKCFGRNAFQAFKMTIEMAPTRKSNDLRYASNIQFAKAKQLFPSINLMGRKFGRSIELVIKLLVEL
jgi:hypothetical protein